MAGDRASPFQDANLNIPPRVVTTLSREQFLYSLARTPSPARFQRPRSNCQILSGFDNSLQRLAPEAEPRPIFHAPQITTPTSGRKIIEESDKTAIRIIASGGPIIAPSLLPFLTSVASVELEEHDTLFNLGDKSGHDSNSSSGEESGSIYTDANIPLSDSSESSHTTAQSSGASCRELNACIRKPPQIEQDEFSVIDDSFVVTGASRISLDPSKKKLKRPTRSSSKPFAEGAALQVVQGGVADEGAPSQMCRTFDQLQLTEEKVVQNNNSEYGDFLSDDDNSIMESHPEIPLASIRQKRFPESSPQKSSKKTKKTYPNTKMMSSRIHFKDLTLINRALVPPDCPRPIPTRLDFCDGFVGEESQPIGCTKASSRPRRQPRPGVLRRLKRYACQLPLVPSRTFGDEPSLQKGRRINSSTSKIFRLHRANELATIEGNQGSTINAKGCVPIRSVPTVQEVEPDGQVSDANSEGTVDYETSSVIDDTDMGVVSSSQLDGSGNDVEVSPATITFQRRVTFNEDMEVIRQQLSMVSAPLLRSTAGSEDESDCDHMDEDDGDTHSEKSDSRASESSSVVGSSSTDKHSIGPSPPCHDRMSLDTTSPSTPIRRWAATDTEDSSSDYGIESEVLDDEMILDDTASATSKQYQVAHSVHLWGKNYDEERPNWDSSCPWAPRRPALARQRIEVDEGICASTSSGVPRKKTVNNIRFDQSQMHRGSTNSTTTMPHKRYHREPSIELGNANWPPRSFYSQSITDSQAPEAVDLSQQIKQFVVVDVPSYFSAASQNFNRPLYKITASPTRSKSMPLRSQYFVTEEQGWNHYENIHRNLASTRLHRV